MGWKMKNSNIFGVHWKIRGLGGREVHEKPIYRGDWLLKGGLGQFADLRGMGGLARKREGAGFFEGGWYPNVHYARRMVKHSNNCNYLSVFDHFVALALKGLVLNFFRAVYQSYRNLCQFSNILGYILIFCLLHVAFLCCFLLFEMQEAL